MRLVHESVDGFARAWEATKSFDDEPASFSFNIPEGTSLLVAAALLDEFPHPNTIRIGRMSLWRLFDPSGREVTSRGDKEDTTSVMTIGGSHDNQIAFVALDPLPGTWRAESTDGARHVAIHVAAFAGRPVTTWQDASKRRQWLIDRITCPSCKFLLKSLIVALIAKMTAPIAIAVGLGEWEAVFDALSHALVEAIKRALEVSDNGVRTLLGLVAAIIDTPLDDILAQVCGLFKLCRQR